MPHDHAHHLCTYHEADEATVASAIEGALAAKAEWESLPWNDRAAIFLKAADLVSGKYRYELMAATILGQGKNAWQAEIDAAAEVSFECYYCGDLNSRELTLSSSRTFYGLVSSLLKSYTPNNPRKMLQELGSESLFYYHPYLDASGTCSRIEYRALEGFVLAVSPFNFTAIGGNLPGSASRSILFRSRH